MRSWTLGKISGITIRIHWTFLLLPLYLYFSSILAGSGMTAAMVTVVFVLAIFGCVLLHELGHALAARQFGIPTRDITLLPIGGVAALERMPRNPWQELWIAVAGPLVNVVIASGLFLGLWLSTVGSGGLGTFFWQLAIANVVLVVFNLIPAFPMDGGRILRSVLALFVDWVQATQIAVSVGKVAAIAFGFLGLMSGNLMLVLVGVFVFFAAQGELMSATAGYGWPQPDRRFAGFESARQDPFEAWSASPADSGFSDLDTASVPSTLSVNSVAAWLASRRAEYCRVMESGREIGVITHGQLMMALSRGLGHLPVGLLLR
jgi:Zn-dependent protease